MIIIDMNGNVVFSKKLKKMLSVVHELTEQSIREKDLGMLLVQLSHFIQHKEWNVNVFCFQCVNQLRLAHNKISALDKNEVLKVIIKIFDYPPEQAEIIYQEIVEITGIFHESWVKYPEKLISSRGPQDDAKENASYSIRAHFAGVIIAVFSKKNEYIAQEAITDSATALANNSASKRRKAIIEVKRQKTEDPPATSAGSMAENPEEKPIIDSEHAMKFLTFVKSLFASEFDLHYTIDHDYSKFVEFFNLVKQSQDTWKWNATIPYHYIALKLIYACRYLVPSLPWEQKVKNELSKFEFEEKIIEETLNTMKEHIYIINCASTFLSQERARLASEPTKHASHFEVMSFANTLVNTFSPRPTIQPDVTPMCPTTPWGGANNHRVNCGLYGGGGTSSASSLFGGGINQPLTLGGFGASFTGQQNWGISPSTGYSSRYTSTEYSANSISKPGLSEKFKAMFGDFGGENTSTKLATPPANHQLTAVPTSSNTKEESSVVTDIEATLPNTESFDVTSVATNNTKELLYSRC